MAENSSAGDRIAAAGAKLGSNTQDNSCANSSNSPNNQRPAFNAGWVKSCSVSAKCFLRAVIAPICPDCCCTWYTQLSNSGLVRTTVPCSQVKTCYNWRSADCNSGKRASNAARIWANCLERLFWTTGKGIAVGSRQRRLSNNWLGLPWNQLKGSWYVQSCSGFKWTLACLSKSCW